MPSPGLHDIWTQSRENLDKRLAMRRLCISVHGQCVVNARPGYGQRIGNARATRGQCRDKRTDRAMKTHGQRMGSAMAARGSAHNTRGQHTDNTRVTRGKRTDGVVRTSTMHGQRSDNAWTARGQSEGSADNKRTVQHGPHDTPELLTLCPCNIYKNGVNVDTHLDNT